MGIYDDVEVLGRILEGLPSFVLLVDRGGVIRYINRVEPGFERDRGFGNEGGPVARDDDVA